MAFIKPKAPAPLTLEEAYPRLLRYCAYQERSPAEVVRKMKGFLLSAEDQEVLMAKLIEENYLSEKRFTDVFAGGKLRQNQWGKVKIQAGLAQKGISREKADEAIAHLDPNQYRAQLRKLLEKHWESKLRHLPPIEASSKLYKVGLSRGFESSLVGELVKEIMAGIPIDETDEDGQLPISNDQ